MKKLFLLLMGLLVIVACGKKEDKVEEKKVEEKKVIKIGITQIVDHPSLNEIRKGIIDRLAEQGFKDGENIEINFQNAQGEMTNANLIANEFTSKVDLIIAITTPSAQAALNATKDKPIFYSAVTDPVAAGLQGKNITGTSDATPIEAQMLLAKSLLGNFKKVGIVYNIGEANSEVQVQKVIEIGKKEGFEVIAKGINTVNEVAQALDSVIGDVDFIYTPVDNMVASSYPLIVKKAEEVKKPIIGSVADYVKQGALATEGLNQYKIGVQTADMVIKYLKEEKKIEDMPFETLKETDLVINESVANKLKVKITDDLKGRAQIVK
ncbi:MAG: ABC transporter substrate-binding protein [Fusobacteriaceae bacterium]|nr:ABC transporter substrate-binding protein [Fusobacteriaceae bacterium]MBN2838476.1 ABC transporter substrate-binding protein [Fusobacteriaceae bacterium]